LITDTSGLNEYHFEALSDKNFMNKITSFGKMSVLIEKGEAEEYQVREVLEDTQLNKATKLMRKVGTFVHRRIDKWKEIDGQEKKIEAGYR